MCLWKFSPFICKCLHQLVLHRSVHIGTHTLQESPHQLLKVQTHKVLMNEMNACIQLYWMMCVHATHGIIHMHCQHIGLNFKVHAAMAADRVHSCACRPWTIAIVNTDLDHWKAKGESVIDTCVCVYASVHYSVVYYLTQLSTSPGLTSTDLDHI